MEDNKGFVKLYRSMLTWEWYDDINVKILFLHLILTANYEDKKWRGKVIKRGQRVVSVKKLSEELGITVRQVRTAIEKLVMTNDLTNSKFAECNVLTLVNYDKYQAVTNEKANVGQTSDKRLTNRGQTSDKSMTTTKEYKEREEYKEYKEIEEDIELSPPAPYKLIQDLYNQICTSYPKCTVLSDNRKKAIKARLNAGYKIEDFQRLFEKAEASDFLKGKNKNNWSASFDWLIKDTNMAKVLDGNYDSKNSSNANEQQSYDINNLDSLAINLKK